VIFPVAGHGRPRQHHIPDSKSVAAEKLLAEQAWRSVSSRRGTKGRLTARFAALRVPPGFLKQGKASCGVARQYTGSAGKITNCQIGVFAAYVSHRGHAFIDPALYLTKSWTSDRARMNRASLRIMVRTYSERLGRQHSIQC
jgi:SRSO17 transposase